MYKLGHGVPKDTTRAAGLFSMACDHDLMNACTQLGALLNDGDGIPKDKERALALQVKACLAKEGADASACTFIGYRYYAADGVALNYEKANAFYLMGCQGGDALGCLNLGIMYRTGRGYERDPRRAVEYLSKACAMGVAAGCRYADQIRQDPDD
jgi:TPR repeat protein